MTDLEGDAEAVQQVLLGQVSPWDLEVLAKRLEGDKEDAMRHLVEACLSAVQVRYLEIIEDAARHLKVHELVAAGEIEVGRG